MRLPHPIDYKQEIKEEVVNFSHKEIEKGMEFFLRDALPDDFLVIQYHSRFLIDGF